MKTHPDNATRRMASPVKIALGTLIVVALLMLGLHTARAHVAHHDSSDLRAGEAGFSCAAGRSDAAPI